MPFLICSECNGYYELEEGESADDFGNCHCGGKLNYTDSINSISLDETFKGEKNFTDQKTFSCPSCGHLNKNTSLLCYNCNSFARERNIPINSTMNSSSELYDYQNVLKNYIGNARGWKGLINKVNWWGIIIGIIFLIVAWFITSIVLFIGLIRVATQTPNEQGILTFFGGSMLIFVLLFIASGFIGVITTQSKTYSEGIINGGLVGGIIGFFLGVFAGLLAIAASPNVFGILLFVLIILWYFFLYGILTASGGILAILLRKHIGI